MTNDWTWRTGSATFYLYGSNSLPNGGSNMTSSFVTTGLTLLLQDGSLGATEDNTLSNTDYYRYYVLRLQSTSSPYDYGLDKVKWYGNVLDAIKNADLLVIHTEWNEYRGLDLLKVKNELKNPIILDLRNVFIEELVSSISSSLKISIKMKFGLYFSQLLEINTSSSLPSASIFKKSICVFSGIYLSSMFSKVSTLIKLLFMILYPCLFFEKASFLQNVFKALSLNW